MLLSPDGQWGVYLVQEANDIRLTTFPTSDPAARKTASVSRAGGELPPPQLLPTVADVVYVAADGSRPYSLATWLGFGIGDLHWTAR